MNRGYSKNEEKTKKKNFELPSTLCQKLAQRALEYGVSEKFIVLRSVWAFLTSHVRADDHAKKLLFGFQLSDDPEDRLEIPLSDEELKMLFIECHHCLTQRGINTKDLIAGAVTT